MTRYEDLGRQCTVFNNYDRLKKGLMDSRELGYAYSTLGVDLPPKYMNIVIG